MYELSHVVNSFGKDEFVELAEKWRDDQFFFKHMEFCQVKASARTNNG
jgi:hypothetical protein